jgi:AhpC/TSA family
LVRISEARYVSKEATMTTTVIYGTRVTEIADASSGPNGLWLSFADVERATGWERKPHGLCLGETTCVPIPPGKQWIDEGAGRIDLAAFAEYLGQPAVADAANGVWGFGPATSPAAPPSVEAPDFTLPDLDGKMHSLADYRGKKVLLYSWASW